MSKRDRFGCQDSYAVGDRVLVKGYPKEGVATVEAVGTTQGPNCYSVQCDYGWSHVWPTAEYLKPASQRESDQSKAKAKQRQDEHEAGLKAAQDARERYHKAVKEDGPILSAPGDSMQDIQEVFAQASAMPDQGVAGLAFLDAMLGATGNPRLADAAQASYNDGDRVRRLSDGLEGTVENDPTLACFQNISGLPPLLLHGDDGEDHMVSVTDIEPTP